LRLFSVWCTQPLRLEVSSLQCSFYLLILLRYAGCCDEALGSKQRLHRFHFVRGAWNLLFVCHRNNCPSSRDPPPSFSLMCRGWLSSEARLQHQSALCFCDGTADDETASRLRQPLHLKVTLRPLSLSSSLSSSASPTAHFTALRVSFAFTLRTVARAYAPSSFSMWMVTPLVWSGSILIWAPRDASPYRCARFFHNSSACDAGSSTTHPVAGSFFCCL